MFPEISHERWVVITSINYPTEAVIRLTELPDWHVLVVGDLKTPKDWHNDKCTYLSVDIQQKLQYKSVELLPYRHYGRKNVGYLFAIEHGAKVIYETDDDNLLREGWDLDRGFLSDPVGRKFMTYVKGDMMVINPYHYFGQPTTWPRGFPLSYIGQACNETCSFALASEIGIAVQQGLANGDPDMDAIFRLTRKDHGKKIDFSFDETMQPIALPAFLFSPFNSQNTLFHYNALWGLLIPVTTTFRVCDIWRGYWTQRLLWEIGEHLAFFPPSVQQDRNPHDYLLDFIDEIDLYQDSGRLVEMLNNWRCKAKTFFGCARELTQEMYRQNFWKEGDVKLTNAWLDDLLRIGYKEPPLNRDVKPTLTRQMELPQQFLPTNNLGDSLPSSATAFAKC